MTGCMTIKIDLEKAHDRLNWDFIHDTLVDAGFPTNIISIIWFFISSPMMRLLWNCEAMEEFRHSRGIRQGAHFSLTLCVVS